MTPLAPDGIRIPIDGAEIDGDLTVPERASGVVCFAHGSGSSRFSDRNRYVAGHLQQAGLATLLIDLLTGAEEEVDVRTRHLRFDIPLLADRVARSCDWLADDPRTSSLPVGLFGASTGAAAALIAASERPDQVRTVVSRGGRPDLAGEALARVRVPVLLIIGGLDDAVIGMNRTAAERMVSTEPHIEIVQGATHLFEEPGTLERVADLAADWFARRLTGSS